MNIKKLQKTYLKRFKRLIKSIPKTRNSGFILFNEYLKYLLDTLIIEPTVDPADIRIVTLTTAIAELEAYSMESAAKQKQLHWKAFWDIVKQNMEDWIAIHDSI